MRKLVLLTLGRRVFRPLALFLGLRYTRARRRSHFVSFITLVSVIGIGLGVAVLITVLSVMNGFDQQIKKRFFAVYPQVTVSTNVSLLKTWKALGARLQQVPGIHAFAPYVSGKGMLTGNGQVNGALILGVYPQEEAKISAIPQKLVTGTWNSLTPGSFSMVIGRDIALNMGLQVGDSVNLFSPQVSVTPMTVLPRFKRFHITGIFHVEGGFGYDNGVAYVNLEDAAHLFLGNAATSGLHFSLQDVYAAGRITKQFQTLLPKTFMISNWMVDTGELFHAIAMQKTIMFVILILIIAVAAFNLVSSLVMSVNEKRAEIAILRTMGASPYTLMGAFITQGALIGCIGTLAGIALGIVLSLNATMLVNHLQQWLGIQFLPADVYYVDYLPSDLQWTDIWHVGLLSLVLSLLATLYPARRAFKTEPAEALRYD